MDLRSLCDALEKPWSDMMNHLLVLYSIARYAPGRKVVEIGVDDGSSTAALLLGVAAANGHLTSIDVAPCDRTRQDISGCPFYSRWTFIQGKSAEVAGQIDNDLDVVFIDGDHSYAGTKADWEAYSKKVKIGGLILFHDALAYPDVQRVVDEIPVVAAPEGWWEKVTLPWGYGLTIAKRLQ